MPASGLEYVLDAASQPLRVQCLGAALVGVLAHVLYFIRWADDRGAMKVLYGHLIALAMLVPFEARVRGVRAGLAAGSLVFSAYTVAVFTSMIVYRIFFHRLRHFPGPFFAKTTRLHSLYAARNGKIHEEYDALIKEYGTFVRVGPEEILHNSTDAMTEVHGPQSKCYRGNTYSTLEYGSRRIHNIVSIPDKNIHRYRRQVWDKVFNAKAMDLREEALGEIMGEWLDKVKELDGQPVSWPLFASLISFDVMGRTGFSIDFGGVRSGKRSKLQVYIRALFKMLAETGNVPWLISITKRLPVKLSSDLVAFEDLARKLVAQRLQDTEKKNDIIQYLIDDYRSEKPQSIFTIEELEADAQAILVAGADSMIASMTFSIYELILHPDKLDKLRSELAPLYNTTKARGFSNADLIRKAPFMDAVLNETMRVHSPVASTGTKKTPPEGIVLEGTYIPGGVSLFTAFWSYHLSERYFERPLEWIPERWTTKPELILEKRAFQPFSTGPYNCAGKQMAMMVLRMVVAYTVWHCDVEFAPGEDGSAVVRDAKNELFLFPGELKLVFRKRSPVQV